MRLLFSFIILFCQISFVIGQSKNDDPYLIKKIKNRNGYFVFYATRNDTLFKIISKKEKSQTKECSKIKKGQKYNLILRSNIPVVDGVKLMPINYLDVKTIFSPRQSVWSIEPKRDIFDTFKAENVKGKCIQIK